MSLQAQPRNNNMTIGIENFREMRETNSYYVDKTMLIAEFLEANDKVTLLTRPRRFGKTLNMSMLEEFFDITKKSEDIFAGTRIMGTKWADQMNRYPVIALSFANVKGDDAEFLLHNLSNEIRKEYNRHAFLWEQGGLPERICTELAGIYKKIGNMAAGKDYFCLAESLVKLSAAMEKYYDRKVYVFIDEYDTPFLQALNGGYYREIRAVLSVMITSLLKGNSSLKSAYLTGIERVAKENIFSGLNNLVVCTVNDPEYARFFGFTEQETQKLLESCGMKLTDQVRLMYDGYCFGGYRMYNPWSIVCYAKRKRLEPFWVNTSENSMIRTAMQGSGEEFRAGYETLFEKGSYETMIRLDSSFYEVRNLESLWGMFVNAGMLAAEQISTDGMYRLRVPNQEVMRAFRELTISYLGVQEGSMSRMFYLLTKKDVPGFANEYKQLLKKLPSYHDLKEENSYHMMMLGMCSFLSENYKVESNRESGKGRSDICLRAKAPDRSDIIMEFKYTKDEREDLKKLAQKALEQIAEKEYTAGMEGEVLCIGLAHRGKEAEVVYDAKNSGIQKLL